MYLQRGAKIYVIVNKDENDNNVYFITDSKENVIVEENQDFNIYMRNIKFSENIITGRYLGNATDLLMNDVDNIIIDYQEGQWIALKGRRIISDAKLVGIKNIDNDNFICVIN